MILKLDVEIGFVSRLLTSDASFSKGVQFRIKLVRLKKFKYALA